MVKENERYNILAVNPGSTSTKIAVCRGDKMKEDVIRHDKSELSRFCGILDQMEFRKAAISALLERNRVDIKQLDAVVGRGGLIRPIEGGTYAINDAMLADLKKTAAAIHASSLGGIIAKDLGTELGIPSYVVDPIVVDELEACARFSGIPEIERKSVFHALNQKAVARKCANDLGKRYEDCRFIVAHLGGGITVGAHRYGRVIDVNDGINGEGPFSPERCGGIPLTPLVRMCFSGKYAEEEIVSWMQKSGGMYAYLGTNDLREVERRVLTGDDRAERVLESMAYQVAKEIGAMLAALEGRADAIILTGGLAYSDRFPALIKQKVSLFAPVLNYPGEEEMHALCAGALRVLSGQERVKEYV